jgi:photosystem II stability/assembly factor-like uncharacterized protein
MKPSNTLLLGTRKGVLVLERGASGWRVTRHAHAGIPVSYTASDARDGTLWACLDHGHWAQKLSRSRDGGATWDEVPAPKYPEGAEIKPGKPAVLSYLYGFATGGRDQPGRLYLGTEPGGLFASDDGGATWNLDQGLWGHPTRAEKWMGGNRAGLAGEGGPGIHSIVVDAHDSRRLFVGISCAGVFATTDGGTTWEPRNRGVTADFLPDPNIEVGQDTHCLVQSPASPDVLWQQNHCGIFRSVDAGRAWTRVSRPDAVPHFGFPIAACERDADTAWVVPAVSDERRMAVGGSLCVSRTSDGGKTWTHLREGLPQENCFDVVYRHALDRSGDRLAFGSTTGNVYCSNDRGESWHSLGNNFPPIYSVRFAS